MAASERLSLLLEARTSGESDLQRLEQRINTVLSAGEKTSKVSGDAAKAASSLDSSLKSFGEGVSSFITNPLEAASAQAAGLAGKMGLLGTGLAAGVGIIAAAGAAYLSFANDLGDAAEAAQNMSIRTGLGVREVQQFAFAAKLAGVDVGAFEVATKTLALGLSDSSEEGAKTRKAISDLGIEVRQSNGELKSAGDLWKDLAGAVGGIEDPFKRAEVAQKLFGKGGKELLPLLGELRGSLKAIEEQGIGFDADTAKKLDDNADKLATISKLLGTIAERAKINLVLSLTRQVDGTLDFLSKFNKGGGTAGDLFGAAAGGFNPLLGIGSQLRIADAIRRGGASDGSGGPITGADVLRGFLSPTTGNTFTSGSQFAPFLQAQRGTDLKARLSEVGDKRKDALTLLDQLSGTQLDAVGLEKARAAQAEVRKLNSEYASLENQIKAVEKAKQKAEADAQRLLEFPKEFAKALIDPNGSFKGNLKLGRQFGQADINSLIEFQAFNSPGDVNSLPGAARQTLPTNLGTFAQNGLRQVQQDQVSAIRQTLDFQTRIVELMSGPGGELQAVERIARLRLDSLEKEKELGGDLIEIEQQRKQIIIDAELQRAQISKQAREIGKDQLFGLFTGQTSPRSLFQGTAATIGRNAFSSFYDSTLAPRLGALGQATGLGGLLSGTFLDPKQAGIDGNTNATDKNTAALNRLSTVIGGGTVGGILGGSGTSGIPGIFGGGASGGGFGSIFSLLGFGAKKTAAPLTGGEADELASLQAISGTSRLAKGVGFATAGVSGAFGVAAGIRQGGVAGATGAIGAGAGATAALLSLAGVSGPAAPILAGIALGAEVIRSLLPDPKVNRDKRINSTLDAAFYNGPLSGAYSEDIYGRGSYYNKRGEMQIVVNQYVQAWDSSSFIDHRQDIADATRQAMQEAHPINFEIQQLSTAY